MIKFVESGRKRERVSKELLTGQSRLQGELKKTSHNIGVDTDGKLIALTSHFSGASPKCLHWPLIHPCTHTLVHQKLATAMLGTA